MNDRVIAHILSALLALCAGIPCLASAHASSTQHIAISKNGHALDFDDMSYAPALHRVLVPAAQSGTLALIDPANQNVARWSHVVPGGTGADRDDSGTTSASMGDGLVFVSDHQDRTIVALNPRTHKAVARAHLTSGPDYVRYVAPLHQVWVTEPRAAQIERFAVHAGAHPALKRVGALAVKGGPESLLIDAAHGVAYTNEWKNHTLRISLHHPHITASWPNTCRGSRGLALAPSRGLLFIGCKEGRAVALKPAQNGKVKSAAKVGAGVDIIAWNVSMQHLYVPGARSATLSILGLNAHEKLVHIATAPAARHAHCVTTDDSNHAYVCDPDHGAVIVYTDHQAKH